MAHQRGFKSFQFVVPSGDAVAGAKYDAVWFSPRKKRGGGDRRDGDGREGGEGGDGGGNGIRDWTLHMISR